MRCVWFWQVLIADGQVQMDGMTMRRAAGAVDGLELVARRAMSGDRMSQAVVAYVEQLERLVLEAMAAKYTGQPGVEQDACAQIHD